MTLAVGTNGRRTLPAPSEPVSLEAVLAERDRLRLEVSALREEIRRLEERLGAPPVALPPAVAPVVAPVMAPLVPAPRTLYADGAVPTGGMPEAPLTPFTDDVPPPTTGTFAAVPGGLDFGTVSRLSPNELDTLPYGLICLDAQGRVVHYNDTESRLARLPKERVVGKSFFGEVAPCTRVREFEGQFLELVRDPARVRVRTFDFVFRFRHSEQHVTIVMTPARTRGLYNLALLRRSVLTKP